MKRIMVIGGPGSGKSTLARALGDATGLPVYHMDHIHHLPGWVQRPTEERIAMATAVAEREKWIFEGGLSATYEARSARADLLIHLDLPVLVRLWRVAKRIWRYRGTVRPDMADGCPEDLHWDFIWWIIKTARPNALRDRALAATRADGTTVTLTSQREIDRFLLRVRTKGLAA